MARQLCSVHHFAPLKRFGPRAGLIEARTISMFTAQHAHLKPKTVAALCSSLRSLLRHLCMQGHAREELRTHVPAGRVPRDSHIPAGWERKEVDKLLAVVDRTSPRGKRDRAILLLAARLGMRAGDIRNLRLEHLDWDAARIDFVQEKTRAPQCLPLTDEIGESRTPSSTGPATRRRGTSASTPRGSPARSSSRGGRAPTSCRSRGRRRSAQKSLETEWTLDRIKETTEVQRTDEKLKRAPSAARSRRRITGRSPSR